ncbi:MAG: hypothetical protein KDK45_13160, partial [Leptospiraceae bacterium]|nr:hypothetical protein [Leptospiraceae bacterium]
MPVREYHKKNNCQFRTDGMATYVLAGNTEFIIDTEDLDKVCKYKWRGESTGFIVSGKGKTYTRLN